MSETQQIIEAFTKSLPDYLEDVEMNSGKLFYSLTWQQIAEHLDANKAILDIGCGFGLTSIWFSEQGHSVTGVDLTPDMIAAAEQKAKEKQQQITFLQGNIDTLDHIPQVKTYDWIICHNVLGYVENPQETIRMLNTRLNPGGYLSIIAHNPAAKVLRKAIVENNLPEAKESIDEEEEYNSLIGAYVKQYSIETYLQWFESMELAVKGRYGIRCVFDYLGPGEQ
ncbi:class I SAM-dependent methyltransferase [Ammoniphilus resinae]|uniref:2-polyprenyl-3-methyl-5-hydroxy-6-metoxy-1, 4-benzoquinol methylase n=1 Tax=Ammoniphilus resinae TaxID=861532 RepID=A0ABS4GPQ7_9BACL|nr:class I SAM-dependent methyltransferase [Ammoniphilus resinae]MBP1932246.1 2-polyprenyl-3-methyl-5-hydroxy-6-metoxy-1,4-benzoquinol methylase [Ammoniphilus resinae]